MEFVFGNVPPNDDGGFHFPQKLGSGSIIQITGSTKDELDKKVTRFRSDNGLEMGNPPVETTEYLCAKWPHYCRPSPSSEADESPKDKTLRQRTTNWLANRFSQSQSIKELEDESVAEERASICYGCPMNQDNKVGCPPCVVENDRMSFVLRQGRSTKVKVGGCFITGQDNEAAAFLKPEMLAYAKKYSEFLPSYCWLPR